MSAELHAGRTFGRVAAEYDRARPPYPREAVELAANELELSPDATVLDLAAGTGKLTRTLREMFARVVAVEPDDAMRAHVGEDALAGSAEAIPLDDDAVDAVFVGDAFHWFDVPRALAEISRVARTGGSLVVLSNDWWEQESPRVPAAARKRLDEVFARFGPRRRSNADWPGGVEQVLGPLHEAELTSELAYDRATMVDLLLSTSTPAALDDTERAELRASLYGSLESGYVLTVRTTVYWRRLT